MDQAVEPSGGRVRECALLMTQILYVPWWRRHHVCVRHELRDCAGV